MSSESDDSCDTKVEKWRSADVKTVENVEFRSLLLSDPIMQGLKSCGFEKPSPVQLQAIPLGRCGLDLVVQAKSGTGKTGVLAVVALDSLIVDSPCTQVLILAPTREIAAQVCGVVTSLGCAFRGLTCETFIGGLPLREDKAKLPNCQIVVGTPGRIKQLIDMEHLRTDSIRLFIVDEADRLFDKQFKEDINWIFSSLPARKQILALSATYPEELSKFLALYMENPVYVRINSKDPSLLVPHKRIMGGRTSSTFHTLYATEAKFVQDLTKNNCVVVFSKTSCSYCKKVKKIFNENNIHHVVIELDQRDDCENIQQVLLGLTGARTVPRVFINGHCIGGASDTEKLYRENQLLEKIQECQENDI